VGGVVDRSLAMTASADRHLLFGLLALQNGIINQGQLVAAFQAWTLDRSKSLAEHLEARGDLTGAKRAVLEALAEVHLDANGGDVEKSLAAVHASKSTRESLTRIGAPEIEATLGHVGSAHPSTEGDDPDRTTVYSVGAATSDGQRFRILRPHSRGGLGAVFVALDSELHREVALKQILDHHADDPVSRARFVLEAEITGGLEHPGIVPVYGLGTYPDGRPYYAMRFIRGDSLKEATATFHADATLRGDPGRRALGLLKLLRRFLDVCNAIEYAHSRGVLHRDLKPSNVIVGKHGETLVADWGLAKALGRAEPGVASDERILIPSSSSGSAETLPGSALGTPAYMSPEQAAGDLEHLGPRSDVYSLGATLYCLLTGRQPFESDDMGMVLRAVQKGDFPPPRRLDPSLDPALEAVCLKAMALRPEDRYPSPRALAEDIERWTADEPITAWREPFAWRARRWARRNRTAVTAAFAAAAVALVGLVVALALQSEWSRRLAETNRQLADANSRALRANADLTEANARALRANEGLTVANARENAARFRAQDRSALAIEAIQTFSSTVSSDPILQASQFEGLRRSLLKTPLEFFTRLRWTLENDAGVDDEEARAGLAASYASLAALTYEIGSHEDALRAATESRDLLRRLATQRPDESEHRRLLARTLNLIGRNLSQKADQRREGIRCYEEAAEILEGLVRAAPDDSSSRTDLAATYQALGNKQRDVGLYKAARQHFGRARELYEDLSRRKPAVPAHREGLARVFNGLAILERITNEPTPGARRRAAVFDAIDRSCALWEALTREFPDAAEYRAGLARAVNSRGVAIRADGRFPDAIVEFERSREIHRNLVERFPAVNSYREELGRTCNNLGSIYRQVGRPDDSARRYTEARDLYDGLARENPTASSFRMELANAWNSLGVLDLAAGRIDQAVASLQRGCGLLEVLAREEQGFGSYHNLLTGNLFNLAAAQRAAGRPRDSLETYRRAAALLEGIEKPNGSAAYNLACCYARLGEGLAPGAESEAALARAVTTLRRAIALGFRDLNHMNADSDLDPLRSRPDFQLLMLELAFPADPFAR
jgi:serine/threonine-protein kinase